MILYSGLLQKLNEKGLTKTLYLGRPHITRMSMGYTRCPAYLLNTSNSFCSTSRLRFSRSVGGRIGVRFLMVIVRSPITTVVTSL